MTKLSSVLRGVFVLSAATLAGCVSPAQEPRTVDQEAFAELSHTHLDQSVTAFGRMLRGYPENDSYALLREISVEVGEIKNKSGDDSLPWDLSDATISILTDVGFPISTKRRLSLEAAQTKLYKSHPIHAEAADLTLEGAITGAEKLTSSEVVAELDLLYERGDEGRDSIDLGISRERGSVSWRLTLDLRLVDAADRVVASEAFKTLVVRTGKSDSYGIFVRGSGAGFRSRKLESQSKAQALRIMAQMAVVTLLGRHLDVPYWRVLPKGRRDSSMLTDYRDSLTARKFRHLLYAYGIPLDLRGQSLSAQEASAAAELAEILDRPEGESRLDFATFLWESLPYDDEASPFASLRRKKRFEGLEPRLSDELSKLGPGEAYFQTIFFDSGQSALQQTAMSQIQSLIEALKRSELWNGNWWFAIRGHSDEIGSPRLNDAISRRRAEVVRDHLREVHDLPLQRIGVIAFGSTEPLIAEATTEEQHRQNRRVEIVLVHESPGQSSAPEGDSASSRGASSSAEFFPASQWPLPRGVVLAGELAAQSLRDIRNAYPEGTLNPSFGSYLVGLGLPDSNLFYELVFFFPEGSDNPRVARLHFRCRPGVDELLRAALSQRLPVSQRAAYGEEEMQWSAVDGYDITLASGPSCLKVRPAA